MIFFNLTDKELKLLNLTDVEEDIFKFMIEDTLRFFKTPTNEIAKCCNTTPTSVSRFVKKLKFKNLKDLKAELMYQFMKMSSPEELSYVIANNIVTRIIGMYSKTMELVNKNLDLNKILRVTELINKAKRILVYGVGTSYASAYELTSNLQKIGISAICSESFHRTITNISYLRHDGDKNLVVIFSEKFRSNEITFIIQECIANKLVFILFTEANPNQLLKDRNEEKCVIISYNESNYRVKMTNISYLIISLYLIDIIFTLIIYSSSKYEKYWDDANQILNKWKKSHL